MTETNIVLPEARPAAAPAGPKRLWNLNFLLLMQGQFVSALGDVAYGIALGFWVLEKTGSTALMGTLMAASSLPRIIIAPFAGVVVDRSSRKWMILAMDAIRGVFVVLVALAAYAGIMQVWMVFAAGIIISVGSAFFGPAVGSALPDIVPKKDLIKANSVFAMFMTGSGMAGSAAGGFTYALLGAPLMFLANGISYLVSATAMLPVRIPKVEHAPGEFGFFRDLKAGLAFVWRYRGIRNMVALAALINFFASMGFMLLLPLFQKTPGLGSGPYGVVMAGLTGGMFAGYLATSVLKIPHDKRFRVFYVLGLVSMATAAAVPAFIWFPLMFGLLVVFGAGNAVINSLINASTQAAVPSDMRGKVFSLIGTVAGGLTPIAYAVGGVLAEIVPVRILISGAFALTLIVFAFIGMSAPTRRLVAFNTETDTLENIR